MKITQENIYNALSYTKWKSAEEIRDGLARERGLGDWRKYTMNRDAD